MKRLFANGVLLVMTLASPVAADEQARPPHRCASLEEPASHGNFRAQLTAGSCYRAGGPGHADLDKAEYWFRKAVESGDAVALMTLAGFYFFDRKAEDRYPEALVMLRKAEESGEANSSFISALIHLNGIGVEKNADQARAYFEQAGERGHTWGMLALYLLAVDESAREVWKRRYEETYRRFHGRAADFEAGLKRFKNDERMREYVIRPLEG